MLVGLYEEARRAYAAAGQLFDVHLDMLYHCDLDCEHCYLDEKARPQLPTEFWKGVIDQLGDLGVFSVLMSGGEIFLRKDLFELIEHARQRAIFVQLKTHGGHITDADVDRMVALGVSSVVLSYYSSDPDIHDAITRRPGSHSRTLNAIKRLRDSGVLVLAACSVMARNRDCYPKVAAQLGELGVPVSFDGLIRANQSGSQSPQQHALRRDELVDLLRFDSDRKGGCSVSDTRPDWGDSKNCVAGHLSLYIDPEAEVSPCVTWPMPVGNLKEDTLSDIWSRSQGLTSARALRQKDRKVCTSCPLRTQCSYCAGQAWLENRDANTPSRAICEATYAAARALAEETGGAQPLLPPPLKKPQFNILRRGELAG